MGRLNEEQAALLTTRTFLWSMVDAALEQPQATPFLRDVTADAARFLQHPGRSTRLGGALAPYSGT